VASHRFVIAVTFPRLVDGYPLAHVLDDPRALADPPGGERATTVPAGASYL